MRRYIDASELVKRILDKSPNLLAEWSAMGILAEIDKTPTADVVERKKGHWVSDEDGNIKCSECGHSGVGDNYCEHCGADMRDENGNISMEYPRMEEYDVEIH